MSPGIRSGVNWMRPKSSPSTRAKHCARKVFAVPGGPSSRTWPDENKRDQHQLDRLVLADDRLGDILPDRVGEGFDVCHVHRDDVLLPLEQVARRGDQSVAVAGEGEPGGELAEPRPAKRAEAVEVGIQLPRRCSQCEAPVVRAASWRMTSA